MKQTLGLYPKENTLHQQHKKKKKMKIDMKHLHLNVFMLQKRQTGVVKKC
jgi:hypothetical protein